MHRSHWISFCYSVVVVVVVYCVAIMQRSTVDMYCIVWYTCTCTSHDQQWFWDHNLKKFCLHMYSYMCVQSYLLIVYSFTWNFFVGQQPRVMISPLHWGNSRFCVTANTVINKDLLYCYYYFVYLTFGIVLKSQHGCELVCVFIEWRDIRTLSNKKIILMKKCLLSELTWSTIIEHPKCCFSLRYAVSKEEQNNINGA